MQITCLHTDEMHVATFADLFATEGWEGEISHIVRSDLLARAREEGTDAVAKDLGALVAARAGDTVLCTCSTLGPLVDALSHAGLVRIDRPMMERAARYDGEVLVALCLESTRAATERLLTDCGARQLRVVMCAEAWSLFENRQQDAFHRAVAAQIRMAISPQTACIVLGQASMQGAAAYLDATEVDVLESPGLAVRRAIDVARQRG